MLLRHVALLSLVLPACAPPGGGGSEGEASTAAPADSSSSGAEGSSAAGDASATGPALPTTGEGAGETTEDPTTGAPPEPYEPIVGNAFPWSDESTDEVCDDGSDNDDNGYDDCDDFACSRNPSVFVCGADAVYETGPDACANNLDDDGDNKTDCADPDCFKNPFHAVCDKPRGETDCGGDGDGDGDGLVGCDDLDCAIDIAACPPAPGSLRILFDQTLDETAAAGPNSDWVVDSWGRVPTPSNPGNAAAWHGALSSFGFELHKQGHRVENLVPWEGRLSHGDGKNPQDLELYDVVVLVEPSRKIRAEEKSALIRFVQEGGGLLVVANHVAADRDGNGYSAPLAFNELFDDNGVQVDPFGFRFDEVDAEAGAPLQGILDPTHPVIDGPAGVVDRIGFFQGCTAHLTGTNPSATGLISLADPDALVVGAVSVGAGRVVFVTDSAIAGDGTDSHGNSLADHDAWNDASQDNRALFLNAVAWLGGLD